MKKIVIISLVLAVLFWSAPGLTETKIDPTKENGLTHLVRIVRAVNAEIPNPNLLGLSVVERIRTAQSLVAELKYKEDTVEHLQYLAETMALKTGDCEDFTFYFLDFMRFAGQPLEKLGILLLVGKDNDPNHFAAIYQNESGQWWVWETGNAPGQIYPLAWYLKNIEPPKITIISFGLYSFSELHIIDENHWQIGFLSNWFAQEQKRAKQLGLAFE